MTDMPPDFPSLPRLPGDPPALEARLRAPDGATLYAYRYPQPAVTATVVVRDRRTGRFLLVRRLVDPFAGALAFPGGFMEALTESIEQTAARELEEETGLIAPPEAFVLVDVRSQPDRDPRNHLVDVGYFIEIDGHEAQAGDDAAEVLWLTSDELDATPLAFDHGQLWRNVRQTLS